MDSFNFGLDNVKPKKTKGMRRYDLLETISNLFRLVEVVVALVVLSWFSTKLPTLLRIFSEHFTHLCHLLVSPHIVFLIGNGIILIIFLKSGNLSNKNVSGCNSGTDLYEEFVSKSYEKRISTSSPAPVKKVTVYQDKHVVSKETSTTIPPKKLEALTTTDTTSPKVYARSQSEKSRKSTVGEKQTRRLVRLKTEKSHREDAQCRAVEKKLEDERLSNEEFQRKIEAFIENEKKFRRQESMAIVLQNK